MLAIVVISDIEVTGGHLWLLQVLSDPMFVEGKGTVSLLFIQFADFISFGELSKSLNVFINDPLIVFILLLEILEDALPLTDQKLAKTLLKVTEDYAHVRVSNILIEILLLF